MQTLYFVLLLLGLVCFVMEFIRASTRFNLLALGLALWIAVPLVQTLNRL